MPDIEHTPELDTALDEMERGREPLFVTGKAGTGKSTLLKLFLETTKRQAAVVAPTGVAALNVGGQTIHSFFKLRADVSPDSVDQIKLRREQIALYRHLQVLVIDEVSMLRADLLDAIDHFLRRFGPYRGIPFGGVRMVFIGDLYQLPPVVTLRDGDRFETEYRSPYFFDAWVMKEVQLKTLELSHVYRQADDLFVRVLNAIRSGQVDQRQLDYLNKRFYDDQGDFSDEEVIIALTSTNALADRVNDYQLNALESSPITLKGRLSGSMDEKVLPTKEELVIKKGAQVMLLNNESSGRWVNGSLGKVLDYYDGNDGKVVLVELADGPQVEVPRNTWEQFSYKYEASDEKIEAKSVGAFTQFPLRLAWAVTIHKAQGKTFDKVIIDLGRGTFAAGQLYVALSRCRTLEGVRLRQPIEARHVMIDERVGAFTNPSVG
jgi:ATP-dependent DNA helicase PIF1